MNGRPERLRFLLPMMAALSVFALAFASLGYRLNLSSSFPPGLYRVASTGPFVSVCLDGGAAALAGERAYVPKGLCPGRLGPVMKRVVARAGDVVAVSVDGVAVNGHALLRSKPLAVDSQGRPMPVLFGASRYVKRLDADELWLASEFNAGSYDSRYFGPVLESQVRERLAPIWTLASPPH